MLHLYKYGVTPLDLATDDTCREILEHHAAVVASIKENPTVLYSALAAHCVALSTPQETMPATDLTLREHQLDPFFLWAEPTARSAIFAWARDTCITQLAPSNQPFDKLPEDCAGDVLEYLDTTMTRQEMLNASSHCPSPEAHAWLHEVFATAIAVRNNARLTFHEHGV